MDERLCAVDRVEDPGATRPSGGVRLLFPDDAVVGEGCGDPIAEQALGGAVGDGDRGAVRLAFHGEVGLPEPSEGELAGLACDVDGEPDEGVVHGRSVVHGGDPTVRRPTWTFESKP